jgi:hypothetical protein
MARQLGKNGKGIVKFMLLGHKCVPIEGAPEGLVRETRKLAEVKKMPAKPIKESKPVTVSVSPQWAAV